MRKLITFLLVLMMSGVCAMAQTHAISGTVLDAANQEPLIGATIMPIGGGQGVATDADGNFTLRVPQNVKTARVSYVGYNAVTVELKNHMIVYLEASSAQLEDVVVIAYGTASKESLTGSVAVVNDKEIEKRPVSSVTQALEGMAPGVQVNGSTSTPGGSPSILIRGINTVNGTTAPLYVVDGVVWNGGINDINPNDVENISVLKDAASCALYGSKGANGVVLITTKRAKNVGRVEVTLKVRQGIYQRGLPQYERLGYDQWNETMLKAIANGNYSAAAGGSAPLTRQEAWDNAVNNFFSDAGVLNLYGTGNISGSGADVFDSNGKVIKTMQPGYTDLDWWDAISRNGHRQEYNVSATGATEKFNVFGSASYLKENGYILKTDFERWTGRLRGEFNPVKYLKIGVNLGATSHNSNQPQFSSSNLSSTSNPFAYQTTAPGLPFYEHDWETGAIKYDKDGNPIWNVMPGYAAFTSNKGLILRENDSDYEYLAIDGNAFAQIILPYGFDVTVRGTMNRYRQESTEYSSTVIGSAEGFGRLGKTFYTSKTHTFQQTINWSHEYGKHHIDAMLNHENYSRYYHYSDISNRNQLLRECIISTTSPRTRAQALMHLNTAQKATWAAPVTTTTSSITLRQVSHAMVQAVSPKISAGVHSGASEQAGSSAKRNSSRIRHGLTSPRYVSLTVQQVTTTLQDIIPTGTLGQNMTTPSTVILLSSRRLSVTPTSTGSQQKHLTPLSRPTSEQPS